jgi:hypothetical protein
LSLLAVDFSSLRWSTFDLAPKDSLIGTKTSGAARRVPVWVTAQRTSSRKSFGRASGLIPHPYGQQLEK